jgi:hypothetical protein
VSARLRGLVVLLVLAVAAFAAGAAGGFVYAHDPQPDRVIVRLSSSGAPEAESFLSGTIADIDGERITLRTDAGAITVELPTNVPVEELLRSEAGEMIIGASVNLGGKLTSSGPVLTGMVRIDDAP